MPTQVLVVYYAVTMGRMDSEKERQRLADLYAHMEAAELEEIAADAQSLTDVARAALRAEMLRRGLAPPPETINVPNPTAQEPKPPSPVMVRRYRDLPEASIAKGILDSAGIESFLVDDNFVRLDWLYSNSIGGIKILVRPEDVEAAGNLLDQNVPEKFDVEELGEYEQPRCPRCHSLDVTFRGLNRHLSYATLLVSVPIPIRYRDWKCRACGNEWKDDRDTELGDPSTGKPSSAD